MPSYLITGAGRGLGLGFAAELLKNQKNTVLATARNTASSSGLQKLKSEDKNGQLHLVDLDVSNVESIRAAVKQTSQILPGGLDNLISNAGVSYNALTSFEEIDGSELTAELSFTVVGTLQVVREFLPLIRKSEDKKILVVSSSLASIQNASYTPGLANGYSVARAALNMLTRKWSPSLKGEGITIASIHPGWVPTTSIGDGITEWMDKYAPQAPRQNTEEQAEATIKVLDDLTIEDAGNYFNYDGTTIPF